MNLLDELERLKNEICCLQSDRYYLAVVAVDDSVALQTYCDCLQGAWDSLAMASAVIADAAEDPDKLT